MRIVFAGTRGAFPSHRADTAKCGGRTNCLTVSVGKDRLIVDAGTGIGDVLPSADADLILLSHFHLDHVTGLPVFLGKKVEGSCVIARANQEPPTTTRATLEKLYGGPFFPVTLDVLYPKLEYLDFEKQLNIGQWSISAHQLNHPGGAMGYRISHKKSKMIFTHLLDHEHGTELDEDLKNFAKGSSLVAWDGCYSASEYDHVRGFGHSTWEEGVIFGNSIGTRVAVTGHHYHRTDSECIAIEDILPAPHFLARDGLSIDLESL